MTEQWNFGTDMNDDGGAQDNTPKGLRTWAESVQKKNNELAGVVAEMQKQLAEARVSSVFEDLGVPRSAAALYKGDSDPEAIKSWVTNVRSAFGIGDQTSTNGSTLGDGLPPVQVNVPGLTPEQMAQYANVTNAGGDGRPSSGMEDAQRSINQAGSVSDLIAAFQNLH
jgi:hypothetical protein